MNLAPFVLALVFAPADKPVAPAIPPRLGMPLLKQKGLPIGGLMPLPIVEQPLPISGTPPATLSINAGGPPDENVLKNAKLSVADDALLEFFRKRTPPAPERDKIAELVKKLGAKDVTDRDAAQSAITAIGQAAVPLLRQSANNTDDGEASNRAKECLRNIEGTAAANIVTHAARSLAARKVAGAAKVLIAYLPYAEDDNTFAEIEAALVLVAMTKENKPDPDLVEAIKDKLALRRGTAAQVLCVAGGTAAHTVVRPLLKDDRPSVRLRAALGLVSAYDPEAIGVLIDLQGDLSPKLRGQAEEYLIQLAGEWAVAGPKGNDMMSRRLRREVWAAWWKGVDGEKLLEEFKSRTTTDENFEKVAALIVKLNDAKAETRDAAMKDIIDIGKPAASQLRRAVNENHPQVSPLALRCLDSIEKDAPSPLPGAALRLLALRKPEGTIEGLLNYLPFCESVDVEDQLIDILAAVGVTGGKAEAALVKGLEDKLGLRRGCAALALCKGKATGQLAKVRKLLEDKDKMAQFRAAQGLCVAGDKEGVPTLIALLKDLPLDQAWEVEDFLVKVAGDKSPTELVTADAASRTKAVEGWEKWWKENSKGIDLAKVDVSRRTSGFYFVVENWNPALGRGRVCEVDAAGKIRWEMRDMQWPNDAQMLRGGNVLVVEQQQRLTERDRTGKIVGLDRYYNNIFHAERLRDGSTFIACRYQLLIVDAKGNATFTHNYNLNSILAAKRFRDGSMAYVSYSGHYVKLDRTGKQIKSVNLVWSNYSANGAEILPNDRIILSDSRYNKVMEFDVSTGTGKTVWETPVTYPLIPSLMANGNIIVAGNNNTAIYEIDRKGKIVKEWKDFTIKPYRVFKR